MLKFLSLMVGALVGLFSYEIIHSAPEVKPSQSPTMGMAAPRATQHAGAWLDERALALTPADMQIAEMRNRVLTQPEDLAAELFELDMSQPQAYEAVMAIFARWAAHDASKALAVANTLGPVKQKAALEAIGDVLCIADPSHFIELLLAPHDSMFSERAITTGVANRIAAIGLNNGWDLVNALEGRTRTAALQALGAAMAHSRGAAALEDAERLLSEKEKKTYIYAALNAIAPPPAELIAKYAQGWINPREDPRIGLFASLCEDSQGRATIVDWLEAHAPGEMSNLAKNTVIPLLADNTREAIDFVSQMPPPRREALDAVFANSLDLDAVDLNLLLRDTEPDYHKEIVGAYARHLAKRSPEESWAAVSQIDPLHRAPIQVELLKSLVDDEDFESVLPLLAKAPPQVAASAGLVLIETLGRSQPDVAEALLRKAVVPYNAATVTAMARGWCAVDPLRCALWANNLDVDVQDAAYTTIASEWIPYDSFAASQWLAELPASTQRDGAIMKLLNYIKPAEGQAAFAWATEIADDTLRMQEMLDTVDYVPDKDWAKEVVSISNLPRSKKELLIERLAR